jgi:hypothetical protein
MLIKLLLAIGILVLLFYGTHKYQKLPPAEQRGLIFKMLIFGLAGVLLLGVLTGHMHWFGAVIAAMLPMLRLGFSTVMRLLPLWLSRTGGRASFKTEHLDVQLQVQTGQMRGTVRKGPHAGKAIEQLSSEELNELADYYRERDFKSYYLIRFARPGGSATGGGAQQPPPHFANPSRDEALQILGLSGNPSREDIIAAHRRLINKLHPDRGGSDFLAARVNQARDILLDGR